MRRALSVHRRPRLTVPACALCVAQVSGALDRLEAASGTVYPPPIAYLNGKPEPHEFRLPLDPKRQPPGVYMIHAEPDVKLRSLLASMLDVNLFTSWPGAVEQFISFTEALLELDPRIRASAASALTHQFVQASQAYT